MPASTVTVRAWGSRATTESIGFNERRLSELSAMSLKQWRVPRTFNLVCFLTNSCTRSSEWAGYRRSVPYSRLPAQFFGFSPDAQARRGETTGAATSAEESLRKARLFMVRGRYPLRDARTRWTASARIAKPGRPHGTADRPLPLGGGRRRERLFRADVRQHHGPVVPGRDPGLRLRLPRRHRLRPHVPRDRPGRALRRPRLYVDGVPPRPQDRPERRHRHAPRPRHPLDHRPRPRGARPGLRVP